MYNGSVLQFPGPQTDKMINSRIIKIHEVIRIHVGAIFNLRGVVHNRRGTDDHLFQCLIIRYLQSVSDALEHCFEAVIQRYIAIVLITDRHSGRLACSRE